MQQENINKNEQQHRMGKSNIFAKYLNSVWVFIKHTWLVYEHINRIPFADIKWYSWAAAQQSRYTCRIGYIVHGDDDGGRKVSVGGLVFFILLHLSYMFVRVRIHINLKIKYARSCLLLYLFYAYIPRPRAFSIHITCTYQRSVRLFGYQRHGLMENGSIDFHFN